MYSDVITPKSFPEQLQEVAYDPFDLMPSALPPHPRVLVTPAQLDVTRGLTANCLWARKANELLLAHCTEDTELPDALPTPAQFNLNDRAIRLAQRNALAHLLTGEAAYHERALDAFRLLARAYPRWELHGDARAAGGAVHESRFNLALGRTYDMLAAGGLTPEDDTLCRAMLIAARDTSDRCAHRTCGNEATWSLVGRMAVATALGEVQGIHDTLYGCEREGKWRYGLIHHLRHDILSDGMHWERSLGYHFDTLLALTELLDIFAHLDVDLWHAELPPLQQNDGQDIHRAYGPRGPKCVKACFDAPFYQAFPNLDCCSLSDSGLANLRGCWAWGIIYNLAYQAYDDAKYAWLLNRIEREHTEREQPGLPMWLQTRNGDLDFARLTHRGYPDGRFSFGDNSEFSLEGSHQRGCSIFPVHGSAVLRSSSSEHAPAAYLSWGPHSAGCQSPAALHLDIHAGGLPIASAPAASGSADPNYLTWIRTTIAHNTVTVDEQSMFPYDCDTGSIRECDHWRDRISDGELALFQPDEGFRAVRAVNDRVYPGVRLDRTVVLTADYLIDAFRLLSTEQHQYDWAMHCPGVIPPLSGMEAIALDTKHGYCHLSEARALEPAGHNTLRWERDGHDVLLHVLRPADGKLILAHELHNATTMLPGQLAPGEPRTCLIVRTRGTSVLFLTLWQFAQRNARPIRISLPAQSADGDIALEVHAHTRKARWLLPFATEAVCLDIR